jgi:hypothetical protein
MLGCRRRALAAALTASALAGCVGSNDDGAEESNPDATLSAPETLELQPIEPTVPASLPGEDDSTIGEVLADDTVTADELAGAYERYIDCLVVGGGAGRYAYDVELRTGLAVQWETGDEGAGDLDRDVLDASCSRQYLGDLTRRFDLANPPPDDLADRQRASIAACIEPVSAAAAANLPAEIAIGTAGEASSVGELQLDPAALDPVTLGGDEADVAAVSSCIASLGAEWQAFG